MLRDKAGRTVPEHLVMIAHVDPIAVPVKEALRIGGLGKSKFWELVRDGEIKTVKIGRKRLVLLGPYRDWLNSKAA